MGTVIIGGGPRPGATIYAVSRIDQPNVGSTIPSQTWEIRDGEEVLAKFYKLSHAEAILPLIRSGE